MTVRDTSIVLFGSLSQFTYYSLLNLVRRNFALRGVVLAAYSPTLFQSAGSQDPIYRSSQHKIIELCNRNNIPICFFTGDIESLQLFLDDKVADVFLLACYPRKLPNSIVAIANHRCINIHPSKLPKYRGADPIFWQLREGESETGVTLHDVTEKLDSGDILKFEKIRYPPGARLDEIQSVLLDGAICALQQLLENPENEWQTEAQDSRTATWHQAPCDEDYSINGEVTTRVAFNFVRAYAGQNIPMQVIDRENIYRVRDCQLLGAKRPDTENFERESGYVTVPFADGTLNFLVESDHARNVKFSD